MTANEFLADQGWDDFGEGYIFSKDELIELLNEYAGQKKIDWKQLKEAYFNECAGKENIVKPCNMYPHNLFTWFKAEINEYLK